MQLIFKNTIFNDQVHLKLIERKSENPFKFEFSIGNAMVSKNGPTYETSFIDIVNGTIGSGQNGLGGEDFFRFDRFTKIERSINIALPRLMLDCDVTDNSKIDCNSEEFSLSCIPEKNDYFFIEEARSFYFSAKDRVIYIYTDEAPQASRMKKFIKSCENFFFILDEKNNVVGYKLDDPLRYLFSRESPYINKTYPGKEDYFYYRQIVKFSSDNYYNYIFDQDDFKLGNFLSLYIKENFKYFEKSNYYSNYLKNEILSYVENNS